MNIEITNCQECPFANNDNEFGYGNCNLSSKLKKEIRLDGFEELPKDKIHDKCPLKENKIIFEI